MKNLHFQDYALPGDSISWNTDGFDIVATLHADEDSHVNDYECYSPIKIKQWKNNEWFFVGVVLSVSFNGVELSDHAASLWGIECNYNKKANRYLGEVARELESEALDFARARRAEMVAKLCEA